MGVLDLGAGALLVVRGRCGEEAGSGAGCETADGRRRCVLWASGIAAPDVRAYRTFPYACASAWVSQWVSERGVRCCTLPTTSVSWIRMGANHLGCAADVKRGQSFD